MIPDALHIPRGIDLRPVNLGQQCLLDALLDPAIALVTCYGPAGTGRDAARRRGRAALGFYQAL